MSGIWIKLNDVHIRLDAIAQKDNSLLVVNCLRRLYNVDAMYAAEIDILSQYEMGVINEQEAIEQMYINNEEEGYWR